MASYKLVVKHSVAKDFKRIPKRNVARIVRKIGPLADEPRPVGCEKLSARDLYRLRQGRYRILYDIQDDRLVITAVKVGHRREVYKHH